MILIIGDGMVLAFFPACSPATSNALHRATASARLAENSIPGGPWGDAVRRGLNYVTQTRLLLRSNVGSDLNCTSCHLNAGRTPGAASWIGVYSAFPQYRSRAGRVITLEQRINECFERSMNGKPLDPLSAEMTDIIAYLAWLSRGIPPEASAPGRGLRYLKLNSAPRPDLGRSEFEARCASCHGAKGEGTRSPAGAILSPPLWGPRSFNDGAGMAHLRKAEAFIRANMPYGRGGSLSDQQARDIADFLIHRPRPVYPKKARDYPGAAGPQT